MNASVARVLVCLLPTLSVGTSVWATPADDDFVRRCNTPGVVRYFNFDSQSETSPYCGSGTTTPTVDNSVKASGNGALKMTIPSNSPANSSGSFAMNFTPGSPNYSGSNPYNVQFGSGEEFYIQWRQRFSASFLNTYFTGADGWKQAIIGEGDRPGVAAYSCTQLELVLENVYQRGIPQMYHSCNLWKSLQEKYGSSDYKLQNAIPSPYCLYSNHSSPPCAAYKADQWMTFQVHVKIGTWYKSDGNYHYNSTVELWVAEENQPSRLAISRKDWDLVNTSSLAKYGKIWLMPYNTNKSSSQTHPTGYTWYDELIVSKNRIPDPSVSYSTAAIQEINKQPANQGFTLQNIGEGAYTIAFNDIRLRKVDVYSINGKLLSHVDAMGNAVIKLENVTNIFILSIDGNQHLISGAQSIDKKVVFKR